MITLLKSIGDTIAGAVDFLVHTITTLFSLLQQIPRFVSYLISLTDLLPDVFKTFAVIGITVFAVLFMLGRNK